jgi:iron complex outermembrane receptor protein
MWNWRPLSFLSLTNAVRVDSISLSHQGPQENVPTVGNEYAPHRLVEPSFNTGALLTLTEDDVIRLSAARAVQLPSLIDFGLAIQSGPVVIAGNTGLRPSATLHYEIDYDRSLPLLDSKLRLAVFSQNTNLAVGSPFGSGIEIRDGKLLILTRNFGGSTETGGEIGLKSNEKSALRWNLSYAFAAVHDQSAASQLLNAPSVNYQLQTPVHSVILGGGYDWGRLELDLQARWQSHFVDFAIAPQSIQARQVLIPNYVTVDARLAYRLTDHITVAGIAQQLNRHAIPESAGVPIDRRFLASMRVQF